MKSTTEKKNSAAARFGRLGGRAGVGKCKARTSDQARAAVLAHALAGLSESRLAVDLVRLPSKAGGGALPLLELPSRCLRIRVDGLSANALELRLRGGDPPIIGRIEDDAFVMDVRTLQTDEFPRLESALASILETD